MYSEWHNQLLLCTQYAARQDRLFPGGPFRTPGVVAHISRVREKDLVRFQGSPLDLVLTLEAAGKIAR